MKKQTAVEWLVEQLEKHHIKIDIKNTVVFHQAKAMEEKYMIEFAEFVASYPDKNKNADGDMLHAKSKYDGAERTIDLLEEYYKTYGKS